MEIDVGIERATIVGRTKHQVLLVQFQLDEDAVLMVVLVPVPDDVHDDLLDEQVGCVHGVRVDTLLFQELTHPPIGVSNGLEIVRQLDRVGLDQGPGSSCETIGETGAPSNG